MDFLLRLMVRYSIDVSPEYSRQLRSSSPVTGPLDLDDLGAEVGEHPARGGRGDVVAEFQHPHAGEWSNVLVFNVVP